MSSCSCGTTASHRLAPCRLITSASNTAALLFRPHGARASLTVKRTHSASLRGAKFTTLPIAASAHSGPCCYKTAPCVTMLKASLASSACSSSLNSPQRELTCGATCEGVS